MDNDGPQDPEQRMSRLLGGYRITQMLHVAARLGLPDLLADGPLSVDRLAALAGVQPRPLYRLLRALASEGVFAERADDGRFELTPLAATLRRDAPGRQRVFALTYGEPWWWSSFGGLLDAVRTGRPAFEALHGRHLFDWLGDHPDAAALFNDNMAAMSADEAAAVVDAVDLSGVGMLADIGGGHGILAAEFLARHPAARAWILDRPGVVAGARAVLDRRGVADRCALVGGDFFAEVPPGADVYTLKDILHDWDDERAVAILRRLRRALGDGGARLLVVERVIPPGNEAFVGKMVDITMLAMLGGQERTEREYRELLAAAGLRVTRVIPTACPSSVLEAVVA